MFSLVRTRLKELATSGDPRVTELIEALGKDVEGVMPRYASLALDLRGWIGPPPSSWAWEDADLACAELPTATRPEAAAALLRLMTRDFGAYMAGERRQRLPDRRRRPALLVVEEAGAVAGDPVAGREFVNLVERARSAGVKVVLTAQDLSAFDDRTQAAILTNASVLTFRQTVGAQALAELGGTRRVDEGAALFDPSGGVLSQGSTRRQDAFKVSPNLLRALRTGDCVAFHGGRYALVVATQTALAYGRPPAPRRPPDPPAPELPATTYDEVDDDDQDDNRNRW